jgi:chemosensory pili system protein ChpA (sensor histidine kinase/response regulator)
MAVGRDYVALDWVSGEINATLDEACRALEAFVADQQDTTRLRFCLSYVHQVQGTLRMVEFHGAALLAREIELLGQALLAGEIDDSAEALEALMAALLQLPPYLQRVRRARSDLPESLLAMINELRAVRGGGFLSESALF